MKLLHNQRFEKDRCKNILHLPFFVVQTIPFEKSKTSHSRISIFSFGTECSLSAPTGTK